MTSQAPAPSEVAAHSPLPWRAEGCHVHSAASGFDVLICDAGGYDTYCNFEDGDMAFIVRCVNSHHDLLAACKELLAATAAAMRVIADLDAMKLLAAEADTREQRFVQELQVSGVENGFGVRAKAAIDKAEAAQVGHGA